MFAITKERSRGNYEYNCFIVFFCSHICSFHLSFTGCGNVEYNDDWYGNKNK